MGQLYNPRFVALNSDGAPISGARLYTFDSVATTTPATMYATNALGGAFGPYVEADANGVFPQMFGTSGTAYYAELRTPAGVVVDTFNFVTTLGADDASTLLRDFAANGRFQVRAEAGVVQIETGDQDGDDIGGRGRLGGWDGTQGVDLEIDFADVTLTGDATVSGNADVVGNLGVTGSMPSDKYLDSGEETNSASVIIDLPTGYDSYDLELTYITASASTSLEAFFSFDGTTYKTGADDYAWRVTGDGAASDISDARIAWGAVAAAMTAGNVSRALMTIDSISTKETGITGSLRLSNSDGAYAGVVSTFEGATRGKTYGKAQKIKLSGNTANIGFRWVLKGKKGVV